MLSRWQQFPKEEQKLGKQIAWPKGIVFTVVALCFLFLQLQAEKSKGRGICREQGAVDGSIDPERGGTAQSAGLCRYERNKESDVLSSPIMDGKI